ncbi:MAG: type II toxin-antitoxin system VapC family toxin [Anaerolineae bacterium]
MKHYYDASALVKLYADEPGTGDMLTLASMGGAIITAAVSGAEVSSALRRAVRAGRLLEDDAREDLERFRDDLHRAFQLLPIDRRLATVASDMAWRHSLRGFDAVHLAAALTARVLLGEEITMVTYDRELWWAAKAEGLAVLPVRI